MVYQIEMNNPRSFVPEYQEIFKDSPLYYLFAEILAVAFSSMIIMIKKLDENKIYIEYDGEWDNDDEERFKHIKSSNINRLKTNSACARGARMALDTLCDVENPHIPHKIEFWNKDLNSGRITYFFKDYCLHSEDTLINNNKSLEPIINTNSTNHKTRLTLYLSDYWMEKYNSKEWIKPILRLVNRRKDLTLNIDGEKYNINHSITDNIDTEGCNYLELNLKLRRVLYTDSKNGKSALTVYQVNIISSSKNCRNINNLSQLVKDNYLYLNKDSKKMKWEEYNSDDYENNNWKDYIWHKKDTFKFAPTQKNSYINIRCANYDARCKKIFEINETYDIISKGSHGGIGVYPYTGNIAMRADPLRIVTGPIGQASWKNDNEKWALPGEKGQYPRMDITQYQDNKPINVIHEDSFFKVNGNGVKLDAQWKSQRQQKKCKILFTNLFEEYLYFLNPKYVDKSNVDKEKNSCKEENINSKEKKEAEEARKQLEEVRKQAEEAKKELEEAREETRKQAEEAKKQLEEAREETRKQAEKAKKQLEEAKKVNKENIPDKGKNNKTKKQQNLYALIQKGNSNQIKIGHTDGNKESLLKQYSQRYSPVGYKLVHWLSLKISKDKLLEKMAHELLHDKRVKNDEGLDPEWFNCTEEEVKEVFEKINIFFN